MTSNAGPSNMGVSDGNRDDEGMESAEEDLREATTPRNARSFIKRDVLATELKLPTFWKADPDLWFIQIETQFHVRKITVDRTKYDYVLTALNPDTIKQVSDIIRNPPLENRYEHLKENIIKRLTDSQEKQLQKLLGELQLGDKKPSQLLREMRDLGGGIVHEELLRSRWIHAMPTDIQSFLVMSAEFDLPKLAEVADRLVENYPPRFNMATSCDDPQGGANATTTANPRSTIEDNLKNLIGEVQGLARLVKKVYDKLKTSTTESNGRSRSRSRSNKPKNGMCFYHTKFGDQATRCTTPCNFTASKKQEN
ncbi:uncharacterized protein [Prorops nasuta]|uniref:uncharacterized protein n=1 Tax=Prorops nasuta TaxID=863751 RepID=UPI0034CD855C